MSNSIQQTINDTLWAACDTFRGVVDSDQYKNYILEFMFFKYISDRWRDVYAQLKEQYGDNEERIQRKMSREKFQMPPACDFYILADHPNHETLAEKKARPIVDNEGKPITTPDKQKDRPLGERINLMLDAIQEKNPSLRGLFTSDFNSSRIGEEEERHDRLKNLLNDFNKPELDFRPSVIGSVDILGDAYMYLIEKFASGAGKKGGEFFTPNTISSLLAKLMQPQERHRIYDPTCGSGSLLLTVAKEIKSNQGERSQDFALYGQESNRDTWALCNMNMLLHNVEGHIEKGDTIRNPKHIEGNQLKSFDIVVANPPFSLDKWWDADKAKADIFGRFELGVPPKSKGDFAFILHMIASAQHGSGKVGVIIPHGVLFRGSSEGKIRQQLIEQNLLEAVIGLPSNLFMGTGIPAAILIFNKAKTTTDVLFVDASAHFLSGKNQNELSEEHIQNVVEQYVQFQQDSPLEDSEGKVQKDKFAYRASLAEIKENDYNLNIPRYVDTFEEEEPVDIPATQAKINQLEQELQQVKEQMNVYLKELNLL